MTANTVESLIMKAMPLVTAEDIETEGSYDNALIQKAWDIDDLTREGSKVAKGVTDIARYTDPANKDFKIFHGVIHGVFINKTTTRCTVRMFTNVTERREDGMEDVNTERTDRVDGMAIAKKAKALKGHRVLVYVEMESFTSKGDVKKMRVIRRIKDLGEAPDEA